MSNKYKDKLSSLLMFSAGVLDPKGLIAGKERDLMFLAVGLMLIVVIPVFIATAVFSWKYRAGNKGAVYKPNHETNSKTQVIFWGILVVMIVMLSVLNYQSTHDLDPFKKLDSSVKPITVQVIALQWKWLFIYPEYNIATVNFVQFPNNTPINFELTSDAPMNSFWIPQLGGQMYAMSGMSTKLHLMANEEGEYAGSAAEISGRGFAGMKFIAKASSRSEFDRWARGIQESGTVLDSGVYDHLALPSENNPSVFYSLGEVNLYNKVLTQFMPPAMHNMEHMQ